MMARDAALIAVILLASVTADAAAQVETVAEIRVHGNHTTPDADVLALSGLAVGDPATDAHVTQAEQTLRRSGRFAGVEIRRRFRSIDDPTQILLIVVVDEHAAVTASDLTPGIGKRLLRSGMWLPILDFTDGYGFTYGGRITGVDVLGDRSRVSVPLTWGGERRAAVELERHLDGPIPVVRGALQINRRVNPHFDQPDTRTGGRVEAERPFTPWLRAGGGARVMHVRFGPGYEARHAAAGLHATIDTRADPSFPRNAVHVRLGWERMSFSPDGASDGSGAGRWSTDARGYIGIGGATVLAVRAQLARADAALPAAEQSLLGGSDSLRGYRAGHRAGDSLAALSAEVRRPLTSPLSAARLGVKGFVDAGTTWTSGQSLRGRRFERGIGGGVYFGVAVLMLNVDVAWPEAGRPRAHVGLGVNF